MHNKSCILLVFKKGLHVSELLSHLQTLLGTTGETTEVLRTAKKKKKTKKKQKQKPKNKRPVPRYIREILHTPT
jgi:hypothetical protein